jgi:hypothetical protein
MNDPARRQKISFENDKRKASAKTTADPPPAAKDDN